MSEKCRKISKVKINPKGFGWVIISNNSTWWVYFNMKYSKGIYLFCWCLILALNNGKHSIITMHNFHLLIKQSGLEISSYYQLQNSCSIAPENDINYCHFGKIHVRVSTMIAMTKIHYYYEITEKFSRILKMKLNLRFYPTLY